MECMIKQIGLYHVISLGRIDHNQEDKQLGWSITRQGRTCILLHCYIMNHIILSQFIFYLYIYTLYIHYRSHVAHIRFQPGILGSSQTFEQYCTMLYPKLVTSPNGQCLPQSMCVAIRILDHLMIVLYLRIIMIFDIGLLLDHD